MTVAELIKQLQEMPQDKEINIPVDDYGYGPVRRVEIDETFDVVLIDCD